jgi:phosphoribosyl 1,2-cyclic phosphodiesterase
MQLKFYGTRGSIPVAGPQCTRYGGNTTCVKVDSPCLPPGVWLVIDAGTGIVPLSWDFARAKASAITILLTHFHHDHTQGFPLTHLPYAKQIPVDFYGPYEHGIGPRQAYQTMMQPPYFPVHFKEIASHIHCHNIGFPNSHVIVVHPRAGSTLLSTEAFERAGEGQGHVAFPNGQRPAVDECMVIRMYRSNHPENTISYRFEERPTGQVFVFVTDHENQSGIPRRFRDHLDGADLLVMDCQYTREKYDALTAGWGHATPDYVAGVASELRVPRLGLTHHDPPSSDEQIDAIVANAQEFAPGIDVFGCRDYLELGVVA